MKENKFQKTGTFVGGSSQSKKLSKIESTLDRGATDGKAPKAWAFPRF